MNKALYLSIKHWEEIVAILQRHNGCKFKFSNDFTIDIQLLSNEFTICYGADACELCKEVNADCKRCQYYKKYGIYCYTDGQQWRSFNHSLKLNPVGSKKPLVINDDHIGHAQDMLNKLKHIPAEEFMECQTCSKKIGSPVLCLPCLHNRELINKLKNELLKNNKGCFREIEIERILCMVRNNKHFFDYPRHGSGLLTAVADKLEVLIAEDAREQVKIKEQEMRKIRRDQLIESLRLFSDDKYGVYTYSDVLTVLLEKLKSEYLRVNKRPETERPLPNSNKPKLNDKGWFCGRLKKEGFYWYRHFEGDNPLIIYNEGSGDSPLLEIGNEVPFGYDNFKGCQWWGPIDVPPKQNNIPQNIKEKQ